MRYLGDAQRALASRLAEHPPTGRYALLEQFGATSAVDAPIAEDAQLAEVTRLQPTLRLI